VVDHLLDDSRPVLDCPALLKASSVVDLAEELGTEVDLNRVLVLLPSMTLTKKDDQLPVAVGHSDFAAALVVAKCVLCKYFTVFKLVIVCCFFNKFSILPDIPSMLLAAVDAEDRRARLSEAFASVVDEDNFRAGKLPVAKLPVEEALDLNLRPLDVVEPLLDSVVAAADNSRHLDHSLAAVLHIQDVQLEDLNSLI
jgi:hypothetical protein